MPHFDRGAKKPVSRSAHSYTRVCVPEPHSAVQSPQLETTSAWKADTTSKDATERDSPPARPLRATAAVHSPISADEGRDIVTDSSAASTELSVTQSAVSKRQSVTVAFVVSLTLLVVHDTVTEPPWYTPSPLAGPLPCATETLAALTDATRTLKVVLNASAPKRSAVAVKVYTPSSSSTTVASSSSASKADCAAAPPVTVQVTSSASSGELAAMNVPKPRSKVISSTGANVPRSTICAQSSFGHARQSESAEAES
mmetsp:Transcript_64194/g.155213  ORF Transcript_64194/g.155213 Transcript_64194/m.155213 type:complete len:256 (-) Transcript_64194:1582-2349(-)